MKNQDFLTQLVIFLASVITTAYGLYIKPNREAIKRTMLVGKLLGSVIVAFFVMPAIMEYFNLSVKITLLFTVIVAYGLEELLKVSVKKISKTIDKDGEVNIDN